MQAFKIVPESSTKILHWMIGCCKIVFIRIMGSPHSCRHSTVCEIVMRKVWHFACELLLKHPRDFQLWLNWSNLPTRWPTVMSQWPRTCCACTPAKNNYFWIFVCIFCVIKLPFRKLCVKFLIDKSSTIFILMFPHNTINVTIYFRKLIHQTFLLFLQGKFKKKNF